MCLLDSSSNRFNRFVYSTIDKRLNPWDVLVVTKKYSLSDWLFLYYIGVNLEPYVFRKVFLEIADEIRTPTNTTSEEDEGSIELSDMKSPYAPLQQNLVDLEDETPKKLSIDTVDNGQYNLLDTRSDSDDESKTKTNKVKRVGWKDD